jgi:hypothetical protein
MGGGGKTQVVQAPAAPNYQESMRSILQAQIDLAPEVYFREAQYQPLYQSLQDRMAMQSGQSQIDMYRRLQPAYSQLEEDYMRDQQAAQLRGLQERALPYSQEFQKIQSNIARQSALDQIGLYKELQPAYSQLEEDYMTSQQASQQRSLERALPYGQEFQRIQANLAKQAAQDQISLYKELQPAYSQLEEDYMISQQASQLRGLERALPYAQTFQKMQSDIARQAARDQIGLYKELQPEYSQLEERYIRDQRAAQQRSLQDQAPGIVQAFQKAQGVSGINEALQKYAQEKLSRLGPDGVALSEEERRLTDQMSRQADAARGTILGARSNVTEVLNRQNARKARENELVALGTGLGGYFQQQSAPAMAAFYDQPMYAGAFSGPASIGQQASAPALASFYQQPMYAGAFGGQASMGQQASGTALASFYQQPMYAGAINSQASMGQQASGPALASFYQQPMYAGSFGGQAAQNAMMSQQQAGPQYFNPESQTGMGSIYGAYNAQMQLAAGSAQADAARSAGSKGMMGSLFGAGIGAAGSLGAAKIMAGAGIAF